MLIKYRKYRSSDFFNAARLVRDVSMRYFHKDIKTAEGKKFWKNLQSVEKSNIPAQKKLFKSLPIKIIAAHNLKLVGIITGKPDEVVMLFVRASFHNKGIATKLYTQFKKQVTLQNPRLIKVKSSRFAESFYKKVGFIRTGPEKDINGLPAIPMETKI